MSVTKGQFRVGTSGFQYDHWRGTFYPSTLAKKNWFAFYANRFDTVEINNTFYRLPSADTFTSWRNQASPRFCYVLKFSRYGSHLKRLKEPRATINKFLRNARRLRTTLGPILVQLPPKWDVDVERLRGFLNATSRSVRWAFEFRDQRWLREDVYAILQRHNAALCIHDMIENHPRRVTANWTYLRFHGDHYSGNYSSHSLKQQAKWINRQLADGKDVFAYFNSDIQCHAVQNAADFKRYVDKIEKQVRRG